MSRREKQLRRRAATLSAGRGEARNLGGLFEHGGSCLTANGPPRDRLLP